MIFAQCRKTFPGLSFEIKVLKTTGDKLQSKGVKPGQILPKGLFTKELEVALVKNRADLAVHSLKDLPTELPAGLTLGSITRREDPREVLLYRDRSDRRGFAPGLTINQLPADLTVATSSPRRKAQLLKLRPDWNVIEIRGNVPTRVAKLHEGQYDAIVLAAAGLIRLGHQQDAPALNLDSFVNLRLDPSVFVPAPAQGALALQCREGDRVIDAVFPLHDISTSGPVRAERELLRLVDGGCNLPFGAWCHRLDGGDLELMSVLESDGGLIRESGRSKNPEELAAALWGQLSHALPEMPTDDTSLEA